MSRVIRMVVVGVLTAAGMSVGVSAATASTLASGVVTTGDGTPLAGAEVYVFDETGKGIAESTTTAADGSYTLADCPSCLGQIAASADGYYSARGGPNYTLFARTNPRVGLARATALGFTWDTVPGAVAYRLTLAAEPTFSHPKIIARATHTRHYYTSLLKNHVYYLQVYPVDADSHVIHPDVFLGDDKRPVAGRPNYVNDLHGTSRTSTSLTVQWAPFYFATGSAQYEVELSSSSTFAGYRTRWSLHGVLDLTFENLTPRTAYYARIRARNNASGSVTTGGWSGTRLVSTL